MKCNMQIVWAPALNRLAIQTLMRQLKEIGSMNSFSENNDIVTICKNNHTPTHPHTSYTKIFMMKLYDI